MLVVMTVRTVSKVPLEKAALLVLLTFRHPWFWAKISIVFLENCFYKKSVLLAAFIYWHYSIFLYQPKEQIILSAIPFLRSSLMANMTAILINFQQNFALVWSFQHFAIKFLNQKRFIARFKSAVKSSLSWRGKCDVFFTRVISCNRSKQLSERKWRYWALRASDARAKTTSCL